MTERVLKVEGLSLFDDQERVLLKEISFQLNKGEILGVFGKSGSGKSLLCKSILNLYPYRFIKKGSIFYFNKDQKFDITQKRESNKISGNHISLMFQNVLKSLNPLLSNGTHILQLLTGRYKRQLAIDLLKYVGFPNPQEIMKKYPSHLSGGELSRFGFALAIAKEPEILILDEAFASIDRKLQTLFEEKIRIFAKEMNRAVILVTHNPDIIKNLTDRVIIMNDGQVSEILNSSDLLLDPKSDYLMRIKTAYNNLYL